MIDKYTIKCYYIYELKISFMNALTIKQRKFSVPQILFTALAAVLLTFCIYSMFSGAYTTYDIPTKRGYICVLVTSVVLPFLHNLGGNKKKFLAAFALVCVLIITLYAQLFGYLDFLL